MFCPLQELVETALQKLLEARKLETNDNELETVELVSTHLKCSYEESRTEKCI
jgi:hypothetical protein